MPTYLGNLDQLVVVVVPVEEWLFPEYHPREHTPQGPHVQRVVVLLEVHQQLRALRFEGGGGGEGANDDEKAGGGGGARRCNRNVQRELMESASKRRPLLRVR